MTAPAGAVAAGSARAARGGRLLAAARAHGLFLAVLAAGVALRVVTQLAYRPALIYYDSTRYLENMLTLEPSPVRPLGYPLFLEALPLGWGLEVVPLAHHVFGLAMGIVLYAVLTRLGVRRWLAALAAAPVLLDAYQLNIEQYVLSEPLYLTAIVCACALVLWWPEPRPLALVVAGLLFAVAAVTRASGLAVFAPAVACVLLLGGTWRARLARAAVLVVAFATPVVAYMAWYHEHNDRYAITGYGGRFLYARVAPFADCSRFVVPASQRVLCPTEPVGQRPSVEQYMWDNDLSPVYRLKLPKGVRRPEIAGDFARNVIRHQPLDYARVVLRDFLRAFSLRRTRGEGELPISRWQFQVYYPIFRPETTEWIRRYGGTRGTVQPQLASALRGYQRFGYTPGPILAFGLVAGALAAVGVGHARRSGLRAAAFLLTATALALYGPSVAANQFTWRYALPLVALAPAAAAVGVTALRRRSPAAAPRRGAEERAAARRARATRRAGAAGPSGPPVAQRPGARDHPAGELSSGPS